MTKGSKRESERKQVAKRESFKICIPPRVISADLITVTVFCSTDSRCLSVRHRSVVERTSLPGSMTKERRTSSPVDQGSHLHMAIKLLKAENANLEKIIILLRTENQNMQRKMKEMEYQNDRFKITQNQLKEELKREKELVRYLHNVNKKYERTLQKKEAESRQLRKEAKEAELRSLKRESKDINNNAKDGEVRRPQPPKRSDSFKRNKDLAAIKDQVTAPASSSSSTSSNGSVSGSGSQNANLKTKQPPQATPALKQTNSSDDLACEWEDVTDVLGFLNEKVNQFERLLLETGGSSKSGSGSGYSSSDSLTSTK